MQDKNFQGWMLKKRLLNHPAYPVRSLSRSALCVL